MVAVIQFFLYRNFADFVAQKERDSLDKLVYALGVEYQSNGGWEALRQDEQKWHELIMKNFFDKEPHDPRQPRHEAPGFFNDDPMNRNQDPSKRRQLSEDDNRPPFDPGMDAREWRPTLPSNFPLPPPLGMRLSLFDAKKNGIIGNPDLSEQILKAIDVNGQTVGWLGIRKQEKLTNPAAVAFLEQLSRIFYVIGAMVLILAMVVSVLFSRHLLAPIRKIAEGTRALRHRRFNTRISVSTSDELGQLAEDFNAMAQHLESYETMRRQWLSDIAHELRTPLTVLRGEIEALQDGIRETTPKAIESLHAEVIYLNNIVTDLNKISQMESGILEMNREPVNPIDILRKTLERFEHRLNQQGIVIKADLETSDNIRIIGDADRISQVFSNILENILRYAGSPGVVTVGYAGSKKDVSIYIEDSGPGVAEESIKRLFDRFYRTDAARTRANGGSGLGLAICKSIVEAHQGEISAANGSSGGLRIKILFPLTQE